MSDPDRPQDEDIDASPSTTSGGTHSTDPPRGGKCRPRSIAAGLRSTDTTIRKLNTLISSALGQDTALGCVEYLSHALHYFLLSRIWRKIKARLLALMRVVRRRKLAYLAPAPSAPKPLGESSWSPLLSLSSLMYDTRSAIRLLGLFSIWTWGAETVQDPPVDRMVRGLTWLQLLATTAYQLLENVAFLMSKDVLPETLWGRLDSDKLYAWSLLSLCAHMMLQLGKLWRESVLRNRTRQKTVLSTKAKINMPDREEASPTENDDRDLGLSTRQEEVRAARKSAVSSLTWGALCAHWGMAAGIGIPEEWIGALSFVADVWDLRDTWISIEVV
ncbi:hypothetical protein BDV26DRAFT_252216 [Aspergillus bertholletiae]|uniref:Peroxisomal biogenesis factor 11 n=1 Tax=Aspergillus bertholletiae TaxID=1226010 RepID=A0A5N7BMU7_9EURO|nr:hypothetical protein BDV26DRAFT_252216 [Aspergillus bertholletiae]